VASPTTFVPRPEKALLGYNTRKPVVRYSCDGRRLVCWEAWWVRAGAIVAGALVGPGLTVALLTGIIKPLPWYTLAVLGAVNLMAWIGWIGALRHRYQFVGDLVSGEIHFHFHQWRSAVYTLNLQQAAAVEIVTIKRSKRARVKPPTPETIERYGIATVDCHNLVVVLDDGRRVYLLESTDRSVPEAVQRLLRECMAAAGKKLGN